MGCCDVLLRQAKPLQSNLCACVFVLWSGCMDRVICVFRPGVADAARNMALPTKDRQFIATNCDSSQVHRNEELRVEHARWRRIPEAAAAARERL